MHQASNQRSQVLLQYKQMETQPVKKARIQEQLNNKIMGSNNLMLQLPMDKLDKLQKA
jgi:hypothetical protein